MLEYIGNAYYQQNKPIRGFLVNSFNESIQNKDVYIMGSGVESFIAHALLKDKVKIIGMVDNNDSIVGGKSISGQIYRSIREIYKEKEYIIVIATSKKYLNNIRWQLLNHGVENYSMFFLETCAELKGDGVNLVVEAINTLVFPNNQMEEELPPAINVSIRTPYFLSPVDYCLLSTSFWHNIYNYICELKFEKVLEIGPGNGLLSYLLAKTMQLNQLDWVVYENEEKEVLEKQEYYNVYKYLSSNLKIELLKGIIEKPSFEVLEQYDCIVMTEVIEHFNTNPITVLKKVKSWLKDGGILCFSTPNWGPLHIYNSYLELPEYNAIEGTKFENYYPGHTYQYNKSELDEIVEKAGFDIMQYSLTQCHQHHNYVLRKKEYE